MKHMIPEVVFMSAERFNLTPSINERRTETLEVILADLGIVYKKCHGMYKGTKEVSFMVYLNVPAGFDEFFFYKLARNQFDQESILHRDKYKDAFLINENGQEYLGTLDKITAKEAESLDNYSHFPFTDTYFGIKKGSHE